MGERRMVVLRQRLGISKVAVIGQRIDPPND